MGQEGVGYYPDVPMILPLDVVVPPDEYHLYRFTAKQWQLVAEFAEDHAAKRARRQRNQDGSRKKKKPTRRQLAIRNLPDDMVKDDSAFIPKSATFGSRWWAPLGLQLQLQMF